MEEEGEVEVGVEVEILFYGILLLFGIYLAIQLLGFLLTLLEALAKIVELGVAIYVVVIIIRAIMRE